MTDNPPEPNNSQNIAPSRRLSLWFKKKVAAFFNIKIHDVKELREALKKSHDEGIVNHDTHTMLAGVFNIDDMRVRDVMIPKPLMKVISLSSTFDEILEAIQQETHSRYPVIDENNQAIGLLHVKDLVNHARKIISSGQHNAEAVFDIESILRPVEMIPESTRLSVLLTKFRSGRYHLATVMDEHEELTGLVTIEDVLEQIVGDIKDEHDTNKTIWILDHNGHATVKGLTPLEMFNQHFSCQFKDREIETVAGLILARCEKLPEEDEKITVGDFIFKILRTDSRKIDLVSVTKINNDMDSQVKNNIDPQHISLPT